MSALTEALAVAQARAINAVSKAYLASHLDRDEADSELQAVGATDDVDRAALLDALDIIRSHGAQAPAEPGYSERRNSEKPTDAQITLLGRLVKEKGVETPDISGASRKQVSELLDSIKAGTYDASKWTVPF